MFVLFLIEPNNKRREEDNKQERVMFESLSFVSLLSYTSCTRHRHKHSFTRVHMFNKSGTLLVYLFFTEWNRKMVSIGLDFMLRELSLNMHHFLRPSLQSVQKIKKRTIFQEIRVERGVVFQFDLEIIQIKEVPRLV